MNTMAGQRTYNIGQIIYILSNKTQSVVPAIVAEEDTRKVRKLDGIHEVVNYKLCIGPKERQRVVELSRIDGEVYESLEAIRETLVGRLTSFVDDLVKSTQGNVLNWYGITADNQALEAGDSTTIGPNTEKFDPAQLVHAVNNNLPLQNAQTQQHPLQLQNGLGQPGINHQANLRENLRAMVTDDDDGMQGLGIGTQQQHPQMVIMPDGTRMPIKLS